MSNEIIHKLEEKIDNAIETIELLRLQIDELEDKSSNLSAECDNLKNIKTEWEKSLSSILNKLDSVDGTTETTVEHNELETA